MRKRTVVDIVYGVVILAAGVIVSLLFALGALELNTKTGFRTPGLLVWDAIVAPDVRSKMAASFGEMFTVQLSVDFLSCFAVLTACYFAVRSVSRKLTRARPPRG